MTTYTSPHTGKVYEIVEVAQSRVAYREYMNPETKYIREYTQYDFYNEGRKVTFTFTLDPAHLESTFGEIEGVYAAWTTSARD
jgi:hypothetical protein